VTLGPDAPNVPAEAPAARWRLNPFTALRHRNFRLFFIGQLISLIGTWMQRIAQAWLVLELTNSPFLLGVVGALQWMPVLLFSLVGGVAADRVSKRGMLVVTQTLQMLQAAVLGWLVLTGAVRFWHIAALATALGFTSAFDIPTRQAFIFEMVEGADMMNAVALNSTIFNAARLFGPAIAGLAIATMGMAWAFLSNAISFIPVIIALLMMRLQRGAAVTVRAGLVAHLNEGITYIRRTPVALQIIALIAAQSVFVLNFNILVPVFAKDVLHQEAAGFGFLMSAQGAGAMLGALVVASLSHRGPRPVFLFGGAGVLSLAELLLGGIHGFAVASVVLALAGASLVMFTATANTALQVMSPDHLRGRVMSMYSIVMGGMTPAGALVSGALAQFWGAPGALATGGAIGLLAVGAVLRWHHATEPAAAPTAGPAPGAVLPHPDAAATCAGGNGGADEGGDG
jgi:MFS family permease